MFCCLLSVAENVVTLHMCLSTTPRSNVGTSHIHNFIYRWKCITSFTFWPFSRLTFRAGSNLMKGKARLRSSTPYPFALLSVRDGCGHGLCSCNEYPVGSDEPKHRCQIRHFMECHLNMHVIVSDAVTLS
jgi:hypothetical protein